ncbi:MAG: EamA family transporter [Chloroflexi bacterium]|nr:EamA family transporter [Chloroflexota bacterium]
MTYVLLAVTTILWGVWGFANKVAVTQAHPFHVQWIYSLPLALLIPLWYFLGRSQQPDVVLTPSVVLWAAGSGLAAAAAFALMLFAMQEASATSVVAMTAAYPVVTALIAYFTGMEKLTLGQVVAVLIIIAGVILFELTGSKTSS